ncbi:MAG: hypothetical protein ACI9J0_003538, partial [Cryomorphaceae bacterium]
YSGPSYPRCFSHLKRVVDENELACFPDVMRRYE